MFCVKNLATTRIIINKSNRILRSTNTRDSRRPQTSEWIKSKISINIDSLVLKGKVGYFPNWHETQSKFSLDTKPNKLLEDRCCTKKEDVWLSRACQSAREWIEETTATATTLETGVTDGRQVVHEKHMPNSRTSPKFLSYP